MCLCVPVRVLMDTEVKLSDLTSMSLQKGENCSEKIGCLDEATF